MKNIFLILIALVGFSTFGALTKVPYSGLNLTNKIVSGDLTTGSVTSSKILDGSITSADITPGTIDASVLADGSITSAKILDGTISNTDIDPNTAISWSKIDSSNIDGDIEFATGQAGSIATKNETGVTQDMSVITGESDNNNSGNLLLYSGDAISGNSGNVTLGAGAAGATQGEISLNGRQVNVNSTKIVNLATPTLSTDAATKGYADAVTVTSSMITDGTIVSGDISGSAGILGSQLSSAAAITSGQILDGTLVNADINASAAIDYSKLNISNAVVLGDLTANSVNSSKIADGSITSSDMTTGAVTTAKILDGTITSADLTTSLVLITPTVSGDLTMSGGGIKFPTSVSLSANANTLDDYEEGTWTISIEGTSSAGTTTYGLRQGTYTKIGNRVQYNAFTTWTNQTGTGLLKITGLPFTPSNGGYFAVTTYNTGIALTQNVLEGYILSTTEINLVQYLSSTGADQGVAIDTSAGVMVMGQYQTDL